MKSKIFLFLIVFSFAGIGSGFSQERYVRKQPQQPNYFIPKNAIKTREELPPLVIMIEEPVEQKQIRKEKYVKEVSFKEGLELVKNEIEDSKKDAQKNDNIISIDDIIDDDKYISFVTDGYSKEPIYGKKFKEYSDDLIYISRTGKYPSNAGLDKDLSAMNSNVKKIYK